MRYIHRVFSAVLFVSLAAVWLPAAEGGAMSPAGTGSIASASPGMSASAVPDVSGTGSGITQVSTLIYRVSDTQRIRSKGNDKPNEILAAGTVLVQQTDTMTIIRVIGGQVDITLTDFVGEGFTESDTVVLPQKTFLLLHDPKSASGYDGVSGMAKDDSDLVVWSMMNPTSAVRLEDLEKWAWAPPWKLNGKKSTVPVDFVMERYPVDVEIVSESVAPATPDAGSEAGISSAEDTTPDSYADAVLRGRLSPDNVSADLSWSAVATIEISTFSGEVTSSTIASRLDIGGVTSATVFRTARILGSRVSESPLIPAQASADPIQPTRVSAAYHGVTIFTLGRGVKLGVLDHAALAQWAFALTVDQSLMAYGMKDWPALLSVLTTFQPDGPRPEPMFPNTMLKWYIIGGSAAAVVGGGFAMKDTITGTPDRITSQSVTLPPHDPAVILSWDIPNNMDLEVRDSLSNLASALTPDGIPGAKHTGDTVTAGQEEVYWNPGTVQNAPFTVNAVNRGATACDARITLISGSSRQVIDLGIINPGQSSFSVVFNP